MGWRAELRYAVLGAVALGAVFGVVVYADHVDHDGKVYFVEEIDDSATARQAVYQSPNVLECPGARPCALEQRVREQGSVAVDDSIRRRGPYSVVLIGEDAYLPRNETTENGTRLSLEPVSIRRAAEAAAIPATDLRAGTRRSLSTGSVTVRSGRIYAFERDHIVEREGRYYWSSGFSTDVSPFPWVGEIA